MTLLRLKFKILKQAFNDKFTVCVADDYLDQFNQVNAVIDLSSAEATHLILDLNSLKTVTEVKALLKSKSVIKRCDREMVYDWCSLRETGWISGESLD